PARPQGLRMPKRSACCPLFAAIQRNHKVTLVNRRTLTILVWPGLGLLAESRANRMLRNGRSLWSYNDFAGRNGGGHCGDATMPRDTPVGSSRRWTGA